MKLVVGLGNPGDKFNNTRHNIGFDFLDFLASEFGFRFKFDKKFNAMVAEHDGVLYIKPQTFMNRSGESVEKIMHFYKIFVKKMGVLKVKDADYSEQLTVIHDELDIDFGRYKVVIDRGMAGHNGLKSIVQHLKTKNFTRVRIGIKNELKTKMPIEKFVLARFGAIEKKQLKDIFSQVLINEKYLLTM